MTSPFLLPLKGGKWLLSCQLCREESVSIEKHIMKNIDYNIKIHTKVILVHFIDLHTHTLTHLYIHIYEINTQTVQKDIEC